MTSKGSEPAEPSSSDARGAEIRGKAAAGIAWVAGADAVIKSFALLGNIAFARLLAPEEFGLVAFGLTILMFGELLSDGGLGAGLIRRPEDPEEEELRVLLGYQLVLSIGLAVLIALIAAPLGRVGGVTAVMMIALPLLSFRTPTLILLERKLEFRAVAAAETVEQIAYYTWGITLVALGAGVWGLATASIIKTLTGTAMILRASPVPSLGPRYSWQRLRPLLGFGIKFQAVVLVNAVGIQLLNVGVAVVSGLAALGVWVLAWRILQVPFLLFGALWRVSYPAAAQLLSAGEDAKRIIERGVSLAAVSTGFILVTLMGVLSPLVPLIFGEQWGDVTTILPPILFALQLSGPISVATAGYLYAIGDVNAVLRAATVTSLVWLVVALPLIGPLGPLAIGLGGMISSILEAVVFTRATRRHAGTTLFRHVIGPWIAATLAGGAAWFVSRSVGHGLVAAALGATVGLIAYAVPNLVFGGEQMRALLVIAARLRRSGESESA